MEATEPTQENRKDQQPEAMEAEASRIEVLEMEIARLEGELDIEKRNSSELLRRMKYLQADMINAQRQSERTILESRVASMAESALELISIKEDIERAISVSSSTKERNPIIDGLGMVLARIENILRAQDVQPVKTQQGTRLDPRLQEAVSFSEQDTGEDGTIVKIIREGYTLGGKVIRPSLVEVSRQKQSKTPVTNSHNELVEINTSESESPKIKTPEGKETTETQ